MKRNILLRWFIPVLMCVCPLLIPKLYGKGFWLFIAGYTFLAVCYFYFSSFRKSSVNDKEKRILILKFLLQKLEFETTIKFENISYRIRIFEVTRSPLPSMPISLLFRKHLKEIAAVNMEGASDRNIIYYPYKGAPGLCWMIRGPFAYDFSGLDENKAKPWRLSHEEVMLLKGVGATLCLPLFKVKEIKGCLCIDTKNRLEETPFEKKEFQGLLKQWCKHLGSLM